MKAVGMIGLGAMGRQLAKHLVNAGYPLVVYDVRAEATEVLVSLGAIAAKSPKALGKQVEIVLLMVNSFSQCKDCLLGTDGLLAGMKQGILVVLSTIAPDEVKMLAAFCAEGGIELLDSPVSGGTKGAAEGSLTVMVAGKDAVFADCLPILQSFGSKIVKVGNEIGQGQSVKAVNQLLVGVHMVAMAEAMALGAKSGVDPEIIFDVVKSSSGTSRIFESRVPSVMNRDFSTRSTLSIQLKDIDISVRAADSVKAPAFLSIVCRELFKLAEAKFDKDEDSSAIVKLYEELGGGRVERLK